MIGLALWLAGLGHFALLAASGQIPGRLDWLPRRALAFFQSHLRGEAESSNPKPS